jgi:hypothetical protein
LKIPCLISFTTWKLPSLIGLGETPFRKRDLLSAKIGIYYDKSDISFLAPHSQKGKPSKTKLGPVKCFVARRSGKLCRTVGMMGGSCGGGAVRGGGAEIASLALRDVREYILRRQGIFVESRRGLDVD